MPVLCDHTHYILKTGLLHATDMSVHGKYISIASYGHAYYMPLTWLLHSSYIWRHGCCMLGTFEDMSIVCYGHAYYMSRMWHQCAKACFIMPQACFLHASYIPRTCESKLIACYGHIYMTLACTLHATHVKACLSCGNYMPLSCILHGSSILIHVCYMLLYSIVRLIFTMIIPITY